MARKVKTSDKFYNARRRYQRSAQRALDKASKASGATAEKYRAVARTDLQKALATYDQSTTQDFSAPIKKLAKSLDVDLSSARKKLSSMKENAHSSLRKKAEENSSSRLEGAMKDYEERRQAEARAVFSSKIGQRIIGGLVDVWRDDATEIVMRKDKGGKEYETTEVNKKKMFDSMFKYFKVDNLADLLQKVENSIGEKLYSDESDTDTIYETVKLIIQNKVADNTLVS